MNGKFTLGEEIKEIFSKSKLGEGKEKNVH
jgi:hypothetical protein